MHYATYFSLKRSTFPCFFNPYIRQRDLVSREGNVDLGDSDFDVGGALDGDAVDLDVRYVAFGAV